VSYQEESNRRVSLSILGFMGCFERETDREEMGFSLRRFFQIFQGAKR
jgi:hypothetical protein